MTRPSSRRNRDWLAARVARVEPGVVRQRGDAVARPGTRRSCPPRRGTGSRRCRRRRRARCAAGRAAAGAARSSARSGTGCWAGRSWPRSAGASVEVQPGGDLRVRGRRRGRGQRDARHVRPALVQHRQGQVVGPEVVAPLRHAVRLVDREQRDRARGRAAACVAGTPQALGRQVEQVQLAGEERRLDQPPRVEVLRRVEEAGPHAERAQRVDLVLHQRDQRRDRPPRRRRGPAPGSGSTATCRRRSASAPARRRRRRRAR